MNIESKGTTAIISPTNVELTNFLENLTQELSTYRTSNVVINLSSCGPIAAKDLNQFLAVAKEQKKAQKSFVICADTDYDKVSEKLVVVPTIQEAHDVIEMDEIERDLGF